MELEFVYNFELIKKKKLKQVWEITILSYHMNIGTFY
jgi:hypothetical protein